MRVSAIYISYINGKIIIIKNAVVTLVESGNGGNDVSGSGSRGGKW